VAERFLDEVIPHQEGRVARCFGAARRVHEIRRRANTLAQEAEAKRARLRHS